MIGNEIYRRPYFTYARQHVDCWPKVTDMEYGQDELDVTIMPYTFLSVFATSRTLLSFLVGTLYVCKWLALHKSAYMQWIHTIRASRGP